jgi:hypothetical protein
VVHVTVEDDLVDERMRINILALEPVARLAGTQYCLVIDPFDMTADLAPDWLNR